MTPPKVTRKVYSAEELHRLRGTQSQPKLREAIEEKDGDDADIVKEHVLRGSRSFAARSFRSRISGNSLRVPSNRSNNENIPATAFEPLRSSTQIDQQPVGQVLGEIPPNGQLVRQGPLKTGRSPTPSIKKKKAEAIVKAHGSPTHVRVTAGGRIVPSDQSPLCHPRYGYSAVKTNGGLIKFAPNYPAKPQWTQATENGFVAQDIDGNLCQIVNGTILPLNEVDGALRLYMPAPNLKVTQRGSSLGPINGGLAQTGSQHNVASQTGPVVTTEPSTESQISALELEYSKLEHELKDVDKTEVIHGRTMGRVAKDALIGKRRELITNMDKIRKAIKGLKNQPPPNAPTSPRAMLDRQSMSPPRNRLPPFLQRQQHESTASQGPFNAFGLGPSGVFGAPFGAQLTPSPEEAYAGHQWAMPPPGIFVPPPPFDGGMVPPFTAFQPPGQFGAIGDQLSARVDETLPQNDGTHSMADVAVTSPHQSRAVSIRAPEARPTTSLKSSLNPMSPIYKPGVARLSAGETTTKSVHDRVPTPLSPLHQLKPPAQNHKTSANTTDTISPAKKSTHLQSSSISSFETADFFPRNTREYSTRHHAYPFHPDFSEGKENTGPVLPGAGQDESPVTPDMEGHQILQQTSDRAPAPPPGTPIYHDDVTDKPVLHSTLQGARVDVPNRSTHNISPKSKREWLFVHERPDAATNQASSSPEKPHTCEPEVCSTASPYDTIDFSNKPREWVEGYQAGLRRRPVGADRAGDFLDGYCSGLLKTKPASTKSSTAETSTGSPLKPLSRRPSPAVPSRNSSQVQMAEKAACIPRPPFETSSQSMDTLKQAVFAPQNENAILTPGPDGPHVTEGSFNLGSWAESRPDTSVPNAAKMEALPGFPFPERTSSIIHRPSTIPEIGANDELRSNDTRTMTGNAPVFLHPMQANANFAQQPISPALSAMNARSSETVNRDAPDTAARINSLTSIDSGMQRQWPGSRIMTPTEWKSGISVAHAAGLATGYFANAQFDGANQAQTHRVMSITSTTSGAEQRQFREASLDGLSNPTISPSKSMSPSITARDTPVKEGTKRKESSPIKGPSPAKAKFEHMAEKVGIKVNTTTKPATGAATQAESTSPSGKRRWRDVWRKGGRDSE